MESCGSGGWPPSFRGPGLQEANQHHIMEREMATGMRLEAHFEYFWALLAKWPPGAFEGLLCEFLRPSCEMAL